VEPEERLTKRERRERARQDRKQRETTKVKETQHRKWLTVLGVAAGIAGCAAMFWATRSEPARTGIGVAGA
jgi:ferric-dicitrate binding protein FerR (iron transport regulator)